MQNTSIIEKNIYRFENLMMTVDRDGIQELLDFLHNETDFFTAPASTNFHLAAEGGLLQHSLNVYDCLMEKRGNFIWRKALEGVSEETLILSTLLHDVCKVNFYSKTTKNVKSYDEIKVKEAERWRVKHDEMGDFIWETVPGYTINDAAPYGHGEKSVWIISRFLQLTPEECYAIRWHMGFSEPKESYNAVGKAMEMYPLVLAVHEADLEASKLLEDVAGNKPLLDNILQCYNNQYDELDEDCPFI